jgi:hypothetical protein
MGKKTLARLVLPANVILEEAVKTRLFSRHGQIISSLQQE